MIVGMRGEQDEQRQSWGPMAHTAYSLCGNPTQRNFLACTN